MFNTTTVAIYQEVKMPKGYHGQIVHVNPMTGEAEIDTSNDTFYRKYVGDSTMGISNVLKDTPKGNDPLSSENTFCMLPSSVTGASVSGLSRITVTAKYPVSGLIGNSQDDEFTQAEFKRGRDFDGSFSKENGYLTSID